MSSEQILNVAIIGVGEVAYTTHLPTLALHSHRFRTVALMDVSKQVLAHASAKFHVPKTYTDVAAMLEGSPEIDLVMIMNTNEYHVSHTVQCLNAGKNVFVEKPVSLTLSGVDEMIKAQKASGKTVFVGYMRRYSEAFLRVKERVQALPEGTIKYARVRDIIGHNALFVSEGGFFPQKFSDFPPEATADLKAKADVQYTEALGDKANDPSLRRLWMLLNGLGSHDISAMREILGMPQKVLKTVRSADGLFFSAFLQYDGFFVVYETGIDNVKKFDAHIEVYAGNERIKVTYDTPYIKGLPITATILSTLDNGDASEQIIRPTYEDAYTLEYKQLYSALVEGTPVKTTLEDAKHDLEIFHMIVDALD